MATAKRVTTRGTATSVRKKSKKSSSTSRKARATSLRLLKIAPHPQPLPRRRRGAERASPLAPKRKGGPVPGTPSPRRTRLSAELQAHARRLFEQTEQPATHIALDCGVDESVLRRMAKREGWVRYVVPPRGLPPVAKLLADVEALEKTVRDGRHPEVLAEGEPRRMDARAVALRGSAPARLAPQGDGEDAERDLQQDITRCIAVVMAHIDAFEDTRRNGRLVPKQHLANARAISVLTEAFNKLQRLRADLSGSINNDPNDANTFSDTPADPDAFRDELARRIRAFVASRTGTRDADGDPGPAVVDAAP